MPPPSQQETHIFVIWIVAIIFAIGFLIVSIILGTFIDSVKDLGSHICETEQNLQFDYYDNDKVYCHGSKTEYDGEIITINGGG